MVTKVSNKKMLELLTLSLTKKGNKHVAELIVSEMDNVGGWITLEDLKNYSSKYR